MRRSVYFMVLDNIIFPVFIGVRNNRRKQNVNKIILWLLVRNSGQRAAPNRWLFVFTYIRGWQNVCKKKTRFNNRERVKNCVVLLVTHNYNTILWLLEMYNNIFITISPVENENATRTSRTIVDYIVLQARVQTIAHRMPPSWRYNNLCERAQDE